VLKNEFSKFFSLKPAKEKSVNWKKGNESVLDLQSKVNQMLIIKCADCGCLPAECKESKSPKECPNCKLDECCCWAAIQGRS